jgi:PPE-repeat protein
MYPPELNSALMFAGAGSGPLFVAASAWEGLATDLAGAASSFNTVVTGLTNSAWSGPASISMAAAATPYVAWLSAAAGQAEAAAAQARTAATAFESALAGTVPTAAVVANRSQLLALIATNILGQNTPAIAMTEFHYMEMWAQDVAAMVGYHSGATGVAAALPSFSLPPVSLAGLSGLTGLLASTPLGGLVSQASGLVTGAAPALTSALSPVLTPIEAATAPVAAEASALYATYGSQLGTVMQVVATPASLAMSPIMMAAQAGMSGTNSAALAGANAAGLGVDAPKFVGDTVPKGFGGGGLGAAAGGLGNARLVGAMSVPPTWQGSTPARMVSAAMSGLGGEMPAAMAAGAAGGMTPMPMPMPMGGAGAGMGGGMMGRGGASPNHVIQNRPSVVPRTGV